MEDPLLPAAKDNRDNLTINDEGPTALQSVLDDEDPNEIWRRKAKRKIDSFVCIVWSVGILATLGILCICLLAFDEGIFDTQVIDLLSYIVGTLAISAILSCTVQQTIQKYKKKNNATTTTDYVDDDDDDKDNKFKRQEEIQRRYMLLFLSCSIVLFSLQMFLAGTNNQPFMLQSQHAVVVETRAVSKAHPKLAVKKSHG